jgi:hypothetical protein
MLLPRFQVFLFVLVFVVLLHHFLQQDNRQNIQQDNRKKRPQLFLPKSIAPLLIKTIPHPYHTKAYRSRRQMIQSFQKIY